MEKLSFAFSLNEEQKKKKEALVVQLMKNDHVLTWLCWEIGRASCRERV